MAAVTLHDQHSMRVTREGPPPRRGVGRWVVAAVMAVVLAMLGSLALEQWRETPVFPLRTVRFEGDLAHVAEAALRSAVAPHLDGGLLFVDVAAVRRAIEALPWVAGAAVWRVWPQSLRINVTEHQPVAAWGDAGLVTAQGHVFRPHDRPEGLAPLNGPAGSASRVLARFTALRERLETIDLSLVGLRQDERRAWHGRLADGGELRLGRDHLSARVQRLITAWPEVQRRADGRRVAVLDLRYPNGFAVDWQTGQDNTDAE